MFYLNNNNCRGKDSIQRRDKEFKGQYFQANNEKHSSPACLWPYTAIFMEVLILRDNV